MKYKVELQESIMVIEAGTASEAAEAAIEQYNEDYSAQLDAFIPSDDEVADEDELREIGEMPHVSDMKLDLVDADTRGLIWARYVGTNQDGCWAVAMASQVPAPTSEEPNP